MCPTAYIPIQVSHYGLYEQYYSIELRNMGGLECLVTVY